MSFISVGIQKKLIVLCFAPWNLDSTGRLLAVSAQGASSFPISELLFSNCALLQPMWQWTALIVSNYFDESDLWRPEWILIFIAPNANKYGVHLDVTTFNEVNTLVLYLLLYQMCPALIYFWVNIITDFKTLQCFYCIFLTLLRNRLW
jgi:hypothetical protein